MAVRVLSSWSLVVALATTASADFTDLRTIFIDRYDYSFSTSHINSLIADAAGDGFTDVMFQVRGRGDAYYDSNYEPAANGLPPGFDPLQTAIDAAHSHGLKLHAWINSTPLWNTTAIDPPPGHIFHESDPSFRLVDVHGNVEPQDGWSNYASANPVLPEVHDHVNDVVHDIATGYDVDGINLDYIRYVPGNGFDRLPHDDVSHGLFFDATGLDGSSAANATPYRNFVKQRITDLVGSIKGTVDAAELATGREILLSADVWRDPDVGENQFLQDYRTWLEQDLLDIAMPMIYLNENNDHILFDANLTNTLNIPTNTRIAPILASYLHVKPGGGGAALTLSEIERAHAFGADGVGFYDHPAYFQGYSAADRQAIADLFTQLESPGDPEPTMLADFNTDQGPFSWSPTFSGTTEGVLAGSEIERTTEQAVEGTGSQRISVQGEADGWLLRHLSGNGPAGTVATPAANEPFSAEGFVGLWLKTTDPGLSVQIALDDPDTAERGVAQPLIADGQWRLYEWDLDDAAQWEGWVAGDGLVHGPTVTLDSIQFSGAGDATLYMDLVMHNPSGSLLPEVLPGDYNRDGVVGAEDYAAWREAFGDSVESGSGADGNGNSLVDTADYTVWRDHLGATVSFGSGALAAEAVPEPTVAAWAVGLLLMLALRARCRCRRC